VELVPAMFQMAEWHMRTYAVFTAREYYEHAIQILMDAHDETDPALIPALSGLAQSYKMERLPPAGALEPSGPTFNISTGPSLARPAVTDDRRSRPINRYGDGEAALRQVLKIREADSATSTQDLIEAYLDLADWNLIFERWRDAQTLYRYARQLWLERGGDAEVVDAHFEQPVPIYLPLPAATRQSRSAPDQIVRTGFVELQFSVNERGRTYDVRAVESEPADMLDVRSVRAMRSGIFRPRITAEGTVDTRGLVHRHSFSYVHEGSQRPADDPDAVEEADVQRQVMNDDEASAAEPRWPSG
jgi:hypothetical protein